MKLKVNHWVNYLGEWHRAGEVFSISKADAEVMKEHGELIEEPKDNEPEPEEPEEEPVRKTRKRKTEE